MLYDEAILTFSQATKVLPKLNGRRPHASTVWRWARKGIRGVRLEVRRIGGRFVTSTEALERFTQTLAEMEVPNHAKGTSGNCNRHAKDQQKAIDRANRELEKIGI